MPSSSGGGLAGVQTLSDLTAKKEITRPKYLTVSEAKNGFVIMTNHSNDYEVDYHVAKDQAEINRIIAEYL